MSRPQAKALEFEVALDSDRNATSGLGGSLLAAETEWSAEHLLLAALVRCTLASLDHHAQRSNLAARAAGTAKGTVAKREEDGLYAFVEVETRYDVDLEDALDTSAVVALLDRAERGCFVGNSLTEPPKYHWKVNGEEIR